MIADNYLSSSGKLANLLQTKGMQWNLDSIGTNMCLDYRGVLISGVNLYYKAQFETFVSVLNTGCPRFKSAFIL